MTADVKKKLFFLIALKITENFSSVKMNIYMLFIWILEDP